MLRRYTRKKIYVWMQVTEDRYSLPIVIADTSRELAEKCGVKHNTVRHNISLHESGVYKGYPKYIRVILEDDEDG